MEMMNHLKRILAWVMTAAMLVSVCPTTAIADEIASQTYKIAVQDAAEQKYESAKAAFEAEIAPKFEASVKKVMEDKGKSLIYATLNATPKTQTGEQIAFDLSMTFQRAEAFANYPVFDEDTWSFDDRGETRAAFDRYDDVQLTIKAPANMKLSLNGTDNWTDQLTITQMGSTVLADGVKADGESTVTLTLGTFYGRMTDNGEHPSEAIDLSGMIQATAKIAPKMKVWKGDNHYDYTGDAVRFTVNAITTNAARNEAEAKTWDVQSPKEESAVSADGNNVTFTYQVKTGADNGSGVLLTQDNAYTGFGVLDLAKYTLGLKVEPVTTKSGAQAYPTSAKVTLKDGGELSCTVNSDGTLTLAADEKGNTVHRTAALENSTHQNVFVYNEYTVSLTYDRADFELDCDDEWLSDNAFAGLNVTLNSTLTYKSYGDASETTKTASVSKPYYEVSEGGTIQPEQYVKLTQNAETQTEYHDDDVRFEIYKAGAFETADGKLTLKADAKVSATVGAFETSRELPAGEYIVVRRSMTAGYTNVDPGSAKTILIGGEAYPYQTVTVEVREEPAKARFVDYNAENGALELEKRFILPEGEADDALTATFTLTSGENSYDVTVKNGEKTTVYLKAGTYTLKETNTPDGFAAADEQTIEIKAGEKVSLTEESAVKNYAANGLLKLTASLRRYETDEDQAADASRYTVTIVRKDSNETVAQTTLDQAGAVSLPRFDDAGNAIVYLVKVEASEQTDGLFYMSEKNDEEAKAEQQVEISFTDEKLTQSVHYIFLKQQLLTVEKQLVDVSGWDAAQTWTITVNGQCGAENCSAEKTQFVVELTTGGENAKTAETLALRGWDANGHEIRYSVTERETAGYTAAYSANDVTLTEGNQTIIVTNTRQIGKAVFTKKGDDGKLLPGAQYAVIAKKADGFYLVSTTAVDGVLTLAAEKTDVDAEGRVENEVEDAYRFTTGANGVLELVLPMDGETSYYMQELSAPEGYYLNDELVELDMLTVGEVKTAQQIDQKQYELTVTKVFPEATANGSSATFTLYSDEACKDEVGTIAIAKPNRTGKLVIPAYGTYYLKETSVSGDMVLDSETVYTLTYSKDSKAADPTFTNKANVGKLTVELIDKKKAALQSADTSIDYADETNDLAQFTVSVDMTNIREDSYAYTALTKLGFTAENGKLVYKGEKGRAKTLELSGLPIYGDPNNAATALTYTVEQTRAPQNYFLGETETERKQTFTLTNDVEQTLVFENEPKASITVRVNYQKEFELKNDNAPYYPLTGATVTLYEVDKEGNLTQVGEPRTMNDATLTISELHGLKQYVLVETAVPAGYCAYAVKDGHDKNDGYGKTMPTKYDELEGRFKFIELTGREAANQNAQVDSIITNYRDYVQFKLEKRGFTVMFDQNSTVGKVTSSGDLLDYCQFKVYAIRTEELTDAQKALLEKNGQFELPEKDAEVASGTYTKEIGNVFDFDQLAKEGKAFTDDITYETGASDKGTGAFLTGAFDTLEDDASAYTFVFREVKINRAGGYRPVYGGIWSVDGASAVVNGETTVKAYNEADVTGGGSGEFKGLFRVELDKEYWPSTEAMKQGDENELKPLAGVTFELILAQRDENGLLQAVTGKGAYRTEFVTGVEKRASYGVSVTVSLEELYKTNGGQNEGNPVQLVTDEDGTQRYEADFILCEKSYPINMVYVQAQYDLHVTVTKGDDADYVTVVDDYLNKDGKHNSIKNLLGEMTYLTVAKYVDGARYYGGTDSTDAVYTVYNRDGSVYTTVTLSNDNHYESTVQLPRNTEFTIKETTAPKIDGVLTDRGGFVRVDTNETSTANRLTFTTGEYKSEIVVNSMNTTFRSLTVLKKDAAENAVEGAPIQVSYANGENKSEVLSGNANETVVSKRNTDGEGKAEFSLPALDYRTNADDAYTAADYIIAEAHDYKNPSAKEYDKNRVVDAYFNLINGGKLSVSGDALAKNPTVTVYNPATTSLTIHKVSDRTDGTNGKTKPLSGVSFRLLLCKFENVDAFTLTNPSNPATGYYYDYGTKTTDENGNVTFDGLYSGYYKLVETIPQDQVNAGQTFVTSIYISCNADVKHIKEQRGEKFDGSAEGATIIAEGDLTSTSNRAEAAGNTVTVTNTARAYLEISKTFEPSNTQKLADNTQVSFYIYKRGTDELATLYNENWTKVNQPITLSFSENQRTGSRIVRLDPGEYTVVESMDERAGYWFAKSAAYQNGAEHTFQYNGTTVENQKIVSRQDVTVTRANVMDGETIQRQMKVDFVNAGTLMAGEIEKTKRLSEDEEATPLADCTFSLYTLDNGVKQYYVGRADGATFGDWTGTRETAKRFASNEKGMVTLSDVYAPQDVMVDGAARTYYVEEISAPDPSYQLAYDAPIALQAGEKAETVKMVNTRGVSVKIRVFGSVYDKRNDETATIQGAVMHIMKRLADGTLEEVIVSGGEGASQPYVYQKVTSDANGDVLFPYLPRLEAGEAYVVFEETNTGAIGDGEEQAYLNPVSKGYKAYYAFEKTNAYHQKDQKMEELAGHAGYYTVVTGEELMENPDELFGTLHFNAYNEPKGRLVILKRDYENAETLVAGAKFSAAEQVGQNENGYAFENLEPTAAAKAGAPETLVIGEKTYTLSVDKTYYTDADGYRYTYALTSYVEEGTYDFAETTTPDGYVQTPDADKAAPWYTRAEATLTNEGGFAGAAFANIPAREPYLSKSVSAINGSGETAQLNKLQTGDDWQTVTFAIGDATRDGQNTVNDVIRYPMSSFVITDSRVEYQTVNGQDEQNGEWLSGEAAAVQAQHFIDSVTVGQMGFDAGYGTDAQTKVYADVYGLIGEAETALENYQNIDVSEGRVDVTFPQETYTGFKLVYHAGEGETIPAGLKQLEPIQVTMRLRQASGEEINRVARVRNTEGLSLTYAVGEENPQPKTREASAEAAVETALGLPKASVTKQVQSATIRYDDELGVYSVTVPTTDNSLRDFLAVAAGDGARYTIVYRNESSEAENVAGIAAPILLDVLPRQAMAIQATAKVEPENAALTLTTHIAADGRTVTVTGDGTLEAGQSITLTVDAVFDNGRILEQIVAGNTGMDSNFAYAMSGTETVKNSKNPYGVPFTDALGNAVTGKVAAQPGGESSGYVEGFENEHGLFAKVEHIASKNSSLMISKYASGFVSGLDNYVSGSNVAVTGADVGDGSGSNAIRYRILVENPDEHTAKNIVVADELPHIGDYLNENGASRDSRWAVAFKGLSVWKYGADGTRTQLTAGTDYTVGYTSEQIANGNYKSYFADAEKWSSDVSAQSVRGVAVSVAKLGGGERLIIEMECAAPAVESHSVYFTTANNNAVLKYEDANGNAHEGVMSGLARVAVIPERVWLGDRVWVDFDGNGVQDKGEAYYTGELTMRLNQYYNRRGTPIVMEQSMTDGHYQFRDLYAGVSKNGGNPNALAGNVTQNDLSGSERYTYELELSGIPNSYVVTKKNANDLLASDTDSDFTAAGNGTAKTKRFYLPVPTDVEVDDEPGYPQADIGLVPVRDLKITKLADNGAAVSGATFAVYGPYTSEELENPAITAERLVGTMTAHGNTYSFVSAQDAYLTYADNYLIVETSAPAPYLSTGAAFAGDGIEPHDDVEVNGAKHSCFVLAGLSGLPTDFDENEHKTYQVTATDRYSAKGTYTLEAQKLVTANGVQLDLYQNLFQLKITSSDDENLTKRLVSQPNVQTNEGAVILTADENGHFSLTMRYSTIPEDGWTQRDWQNKTYTYEVEEINTGFDGVTYDTTKYVVTVTFEDKGDGKLTPNAAISRKQSAQSEESLERELIFNNELARRDLTITKTTQGNTQNDDAFAVKLTLHRGDIVPVDGEYPLEVTEQDGGSTTDTLTVANGEAELSIRGGQTVTVKDILVGTAYTVVETNDRALGYNIDGSEFTAAGEGRISEKTEERAEVDLVNVRSAGSLEISKTIEGADPVNERTFSFTTVITYPEDVDLTKEANLPVVPTGSVRSVEGQTVTVSGVALTVTQTERTNTATIGNILSGAAYKVSEDDGFTDWGYVAYIGSGAEEKLGREQSGTMGGETQTAVFTNVRSAGNLVIGKKTEGAGVRTGLAADTTTYQITVTLRNDNATLDGHVGTSNMEDGQAYPLSGHEQTLTMALRNGETVTFEKLPVGTTYSVAEDEETYRKLGFVISYQDGSQKETKNEGVISENAASVVLVLNTRDTHDVSITKHVLGQMAKENDEFDFTVKISNPEGSGLLDEAVYRRYGYTVNNGAERTLDFTQNDEQTIRLKKDETATIFDLPDGAVITVEEAMSEPHAKEGYTLKSTETVQDTRKNIVGYTFTNERYMGALTLTKALEGTGSDKGYGKTFSFNVKLWNERDLDLTDAQTSTRPNGVTLARTDETVNGHAVYAGTVSLEIGANGEMAAKTIENIPFDTHYEVTEQDERGSGFMVDTASYSGVIDMENETGRTIETAFVNTRQSGTFALTKALEGNAAEADRAFTFRMKLENALFDAATQRAAYDVLISEEGRNDVQTTVKRDGETGEYILNLKGGQTVTMLDVLYGTKITVTEDDYTAAGYEAVSGQETDVSQSTPNAAMLFTNVRNAGTVDVTKNALGNAVKFDRNGEAAFSFTATLTYADWIDLSRADNLPTVDGRQPRNMTVDEEKHTVTLELSIPVTEEARTGSLTIGNILKGTQYEVHEVIDEQEGYVLTVSTENGSVDGDAVIGTIGNELVGDAAFTNTRNVGTLDITKTLAGTGYNDRVAESDAVRTSFGFAVRFWRDDNVALTGDNQPTVDGEKLALDARTEDGVTYYDGHITVDLSEGEAATGETRAAAIGNILADTHYEVTEDERGYRSEGYVVNRETQSGVMADERGTLRFVNTRDTGRLTITKNLEGGTAEYGRGFEMTVTLSRNDSVVLAGTYQTLNGQPIVFTANANGGATARVNVAGGGSVTILGIPSGTSYAITEADYSADRYTTSSTNAAGTIASGQTAQATFLNTRANPGYGALTITKTVEAIDGAVIPDTKFTFDIGLTLENGDAFTGTLRTTSQSGETGSLYVTGGTASIQLGHGEQLTLSGIPLGAGYTVTERAAQDMRTTSTGSTGTIRGTAHTAAFVNTMTQAYTDLTVRKAWNDANDAQKLRPQSVTVEVTRNGQTLTTLTLDAENRWTQTLTELPMLDENGAAYVYDVRETDVPEGYTASVTARGMTFTVINTHRIDDGFAPVDPQNRRSGSLTILDDLGVPLGGGINMNEGDCFN